jgi:hypothetical protein
LYLSYDDICQHVSGPGKLGASESRVMARLFDNYLEHDPDPIITVEAFVDAVLSTSSDCILSFKREILKITHAAVRAQVMVCFSP